MYKQQGCSHPRIPSNCDQTKLFLLIALSLQLMAVVMPLEAEEPKHWYAYPTNAYHWFWTQEEAVQDFQSKGVPYIYSTEALPPIFYDKYKVIYYKIPDLPLEITDWIYNHSSTSTDFLTENEVYENIQSGYFDSIPPYCGDVIGPVTQGEWISGDLVFGYPTSETKTYEFNLWSGDYYIHWPDNYKPCTLDTIDTRYIHRYRSVRCTLGLYDPERDLCAGSSYGRVTAYALYYMAPKPMQCPTEANPCNPATGNKTQTETDYVLSKSGLKVQRHYASQGVGDGMNNLGPRWRHNYSQRLDGYEEPAYTEYKGSKTSLYETPRAACIEGWNEIKQTAYGGLLSDATVLYSSGVCNVRQNYVTVISLLIHNTLDGRKDAGTSTKIRTISRDDGQGHVFLYKNYQWQSLYPTNATLTQNNTTWTYQTPDGVSETYDSGGKLISSKNTNGQITTFTYDEHNRLAAVTGHFGDTLTYTYDESGHLIRIVTPEGNLAYNYDDKGRLARVTYINGNERLYHYEDTNFPQHLTGITDESGNRFATWAYDDKGRAILSEHTDGAERTNFTYNSDGTTKVTDAKGAERTYNFEIKQSTMRVTHIEGDRCTICPNGGIKAYTYDSNGFIASKTDWNGIVTTYTRDAQGRELSRTEASSTPEARTITTTWDIMLNKPLTITDSKQITEYSYDSDGRLLSKKQRAIQ
ncbi:MAG: DUF6531 domain-containing protein [Candidatus Thiodiazotropha endolucinida]